ncbi:hypothetical protein SAMN04488026_11821 [Aliiruegeria lutimaris]|uniref:Uncharacterized protein n=2 Tax=Aliiruegeria lutimaris TaxID=571298 RepID=A0A1G9QM10_9RHOB|nr:hypothetical protein SAMN04488026_11821 [Aliiruegeria lutimaris]
MVDRFNASLEKCDLAKGGSLDEIRHAAWGVMFVVSEMSGAGLLTPEIEEVAKTKGLDCYRRRLSDGYWDADLRRYGGGEDDALKELFRKQKTRSIFLAPPPSR